MAIFISLGENCTPRIKLKHEYGLSKQGGYKSCPFDLCITPFESLCKILENNFDTFFDNLKIIKWGDAEGDRSLAGPGKTAISNEAGMVFNHEGGGHSHLFRIGKNDDEFYSRDDFKEFKNKYSKRIENFKSNLKSSNKIIFLYADKDPLNSTFNVEKVEKIIKEKYGSINIEFKKVG